MTRKQLDTAMAVVRTVCALIVTYIWISRALH